MKSIGPSKEVQTLLGPMLYADIFTTTLCLMEIYRKIFLSSIRVVPKWMRLNFGPSLAKLRAISLSAAERNYLCIYYVMCGIIVLYPTNQIAAAIAIAHF